MASDTTHRLALPFFALFIAIAAAVAYAPRVSHYRGWEENRANNFAGEVAASGTDSYYWFRVARELRDGTWESESVDPLRDHPRFRALVDDMRADFDRQRRALERDGLAIAE